VQWDRFEIAAGILGKCVFSVIGAPLSEPTLALSAYRQTSLADRAYRDTVLARCHFLCYIFAIDISGHEQRGSNMRIVGGIHCLVWGGLAALIYGSATSPDRTVNAAVPRSIVKAAVTPPGATPTPADTDAEITDPEAKISELSASDACAKTDECIDQYLWSIYERARKVDTIKVHEQIKVTVKKKGKTRTVAKTVTKFVNEDFAWKDPDAAQKVGMSVAEYVIGGMDLGFKVRLYHLCRALDAAGLAPGMTSGFRDDYRQSIASGNKAASDSSYHGGTRRGGYGHGLAADVVSVRGETRSERLISSDIMWKWIDEHGQAFGIGRPYLDRDAPHVGPIDGKEYADKRGLNVKRAGL
jgi:hypothetical protein